MNIVAGAFKVALGLDQVDRRLDFGNVTAGLQLADNLQNEALVGCLGISLLECLRKRGAVIHLGVSSLF